MITRKKMPAVQPPVKMEAALDVILYAAAHSTTPDKFHGRASFYFDEHRVIEYKSRWHLKTGSGGIERIRREAIQYLTDMRRQIDEALPRLESAVPDKDNTIHVCSSAYSEFAPDDNP